MNDVMNHLGHFFSTEAFPKSLNCSHKQKLKQNSSISFFSKRKSNIKDERIKTISQFPPLYIEKSTKKDQKYKIAGLTSIFQKLFSHPSNNYFQKSSTPPISMQQKQIVSTSSAIQKAWNLEQELLQKQSLFKEAIQFFKKVSAKRSLIPSKDLSSLGNNVSERTLIDHLLEDHTGFCIGERHSESAARDFLIKNMQYLATKNVKIIGIEGISEDKQTAIDAYIFQDPSIWTTETTEKINELFKKFQSFCSPEDKNYAFENIIELARKYKIRVIGLDYDDTRFIHGYKDENSKIELISFTVRQAMMNYTAALAMDKALKILQPNEKFVCFTGKGHLLRLMNNPNILGIANLLQCPSLMFEGNIFDGNFQRIRNVTYKDNRKAFLDPFTVIISYK